MKFNRSAALHATTIAAATLGLTFVSMTQAATGGTWRSGPTPAAFGDCGVLNAILAAGDIEGVGGTNGQFGSFSHGDVITVTVGLAGASSASFRIVGDPSGLVTLAGPSTVPGTLTYTVTGSLPSGSGGIGYYIDSVNGQAVTVGGSCRDAPRTVPAWTAGVGLGVSMALGLIGLAAWRRRTTK